MNTTQLSTHLVAGSGSQPQLVVLNFDFNVLCGALLSSPQALVETDEHVIPE